MPKWRIKYLDIRKSLIHQVIVEAETRFIAERLGWDIFTLQRIAQRYTTPLKDDYALYGVVEIKDEGNTQDIS